MKISRPMLWFCAAVAVLIALAIWFAKQSPETVVPTLVETNAAPPPATTQANRKPNQHAARNTNVLAAQPAPGPSASAPPRQTTAEQMKEGLATLNDVPIVFYGKLEDQFGNPVVGAQVAGNTIIYNGMKSGAEHVSVTSDANGFFQINAGKGESLGLWPSKEGYALATTGTEFKYSYMYPQHFVPDPNNPTVIKMWKLQGAEPLVGIHQRYKFHYTDAPINFDLIAGKIVPSGGDLKVTVNRPGGIISQQHPQNWSIQIEAIDGGFIVTSFAESRTTYSAPESSYEPSGTFANNNGPDLVDQMFFLQSRNGQVFSKFHLLFSINNTPDGFMDITFSGVANTNGSRNWEATAPK
ncbi:MAG: hypothetical protein ABSD29_14910 [Verrucomicrobiota bacterium]|jgi:hypothetical protein